MVKTKTPKKSKPKESKVFTVPQEFLDKFGNCINRKEFIDNSCLGLTKRKETVCKKKVTTYVDKMINKGVEAAVKKCINFKLTEDYEKQIPDSAGAFDTSSGESSKKKLKSAKSEGDVYKTSKERETDRIIEKMYHKTPTKTDQLTIEKFGEVYKGNKPKIMSKSLSEKLENIEKAE